MLNKINIYSEIGRLNTILLHRPGKELMNIVPSLMKELLFDEIPYMEEAQREHDEFADTLRNNGVEVLYIEDLAAQSITSEEIKKCFIEEFILEANIRGPREIELVRNLLNSYEDNKQLVLKMAEGIRKDELPAHSGKGLQEMVSSRDIFVTMPMPNLYFTRDTFALIGSGVCMNAMWSNVRHRETVFGDLIFKHHPNFVDNRPPFWYDKNEKFTLEGGDIIVLSDKVLAIGISQRTEARAIEIFAKNLLSSEAGFNKVLCFVLPKRRACMHLDTVFTMVDNDLFTVYPGIEESLEIYELSYQNGTINTKILTTDLKETLESYLNVDGVKLIRQGERGILDAAREQWSDGYNTLAIAPREVIVYERNLVINELLDKNGVKLHVIKSGELSRGRGGPRCMSMPMNRSAL